MNPKFKSILKIFEEEILIYIILLMIAIVVFPGYIRQLTRVILKESIEIGDEFGGGKVAYILEKGDPGYDSVIVHGLIAAPNDQSQGIVYSKKRYFDFDKMAMDSDCISYNASKLCSDLILKGYTDWYLPAKDELELLYKHKDEIGGFTDSVYWSAGEFSYFTTCSNIYPYEGVYGKSFKDGNEVSCLKFDKHSVRAVR